MRKPELESHTDAEVREGCDVPGPDSTAGSRKPGKTLFPCRPLTWQCLQGKRHPSALRSRHFDFLMQDWSCLLREPHQAPQSFLLLNFCDPHPANVYKACAVCQVLWKDIRNLSWQMSITRISFRFWHSLGLEPYWTQLFTLNFCVPCNERRAFFPMSFPSLPFASLSQLEFTFESFFQETFFASYLAYLFRNGMRWMDG